MGEIEKENEDCTIFFFTREKLFCGVSTWMNWVNKKIGEIFSSEGATLYMNPSAQSVMYKLNDESSNSR